MSMNTVWRVLICVVIGLGAFFFLNSLMISAERPDSLSAPRHQDAHQSPALASANGTYTVYLPMMSQCWSTRIPPFGIQFYGKLDANSGLEQAVDAGGRWARLPLSWVSIEPTDTEPEKYDWSVLDVSVTNAAQSEVELILTMAGQPSWAAVYGMGPLTDTADLLEFAGALVERYDGDGVDDAPGSPQVHYFELYNEPDNADVGHALSGGWGYWGHNGAGYAELLQELYPVVKAADSQAKLVLGGIALDWFDDNDPPGPFDRYFLDDVLAACQGKNCFDVMNFHYYPPFRARWEPYGPGIIGKTNYVRERLAAYGFADMPVICTETSWGSGADWGSDELQSRYTAKGYVRGMAAGLDVVVWFEILDRDPTLSGLLDNSLQPKPSYWAYQAMSNMLRDAVYQRPLTLAETGSDQIAGYVFQLCNQRIDVVWTEDDTPYDPNDDPVLPLTVQAETLRVVDKVGNETFYGNENDGVADGQITVYVGGSPLYLEYNP